MVTRSCPSPTEPRILCHDSTRGYLGQITQVDERHFRAERVRPDDDGRHSRTFDDSLVALAWVEG